MLIFTVAPLPKNWGVEKFGGIYSGPEGDFPAYGDRTLSTENNLIAYRHLEGEPSSFDYGTRMGEKVPDFLMHFRHRPMLNIINC